MGEMVILRVLFSKLNFWLNKKVSTVCQSGNARVNKNCPRGAHVLIEKLVQSVTVTMYYPRTRA